MKLARLSRASDDLARLYEGVADDVLARRPSPREWSMKEIGGHMLDVTELFCRRVSGMLATSAGVSIDSPVPPWRLLEGKGYPEMPGAEILDRFRRGNDEAIGLVERLRPADWARHELIRERATSILDLAIWLANHDTAHLEQIKALREDRWRARGIDS